jgi:hypothetical protein
LKALLTAGQVATQLQVPPRAVRALGIPLVRIGKGKGQIRYRQEDVDAYINLRIEYARVEGEARANRTERRPPKVGLSVLPSRETLQKIRMGYGGGSGQGGKTQTH